MRLALALLHLGAQSPELPRPQATAAVAEVAERAPIINSSLEDLLQTEVTSVARKSQRLADVAAAVFVITADDIANSGARSIPEVLRLAPGVDAVRISGDRWAVSIRGFTDRFANKLLVLVDGRNAYNPAFSGVFWETLQVPLADIQRIEVVRGPGASVWGTNAVNGVINIITKTAAATHGGSVQAGGGSREGGFAEAHYGNRINGSDTHYRVYARGQSAGAMQRPEGGKADDAYRSSAAGFRLDSYGQSGASWNLSGDAFKVRNESEFLLPAPPPQFVEVASPDEQFDGGNLRGRYTRRSDSGSELEVQLAYAYSHSQLGVLGTDLRQTLDFDIQEHFHPIAGHEFTVGGGYRNSHDNEADGSQQRLSRASETLQVSSLFAQDEFPLADSLRGTLGLRLDHNQYTGLEWQPTARLLWNIDERSSAWLSASRAVRTPSRGERTFSYTVAFVAPGVPVTIQGSDDFDSEQLTAYELGLRTQLTPRLFVDATTYYHQYSSLRSASSTPSLVQVLDNSGQLALYGEETSLDWRLSSQWHMQASYAYAQPANVSNVTFEAQQVVKHIASLQAGWTSSSGVNVNAVLRHLSKRHSIANFPGAEVPAFTTADLVLRWPLTPQLELTVVGQDLLDSRHAEYRLQAPMISATDVQRGGYAAIKYRF